MTIYLLGCWISFLLSMILQIKICIEDNRKTYRQLFKLSVGKIFILTILSWLGSFYWTLYIIKILWKKFKNNFRF